MNLFSVVVSLPWSPSASQSAAWVEEIVSEVVVATSAFSSHNWWAYLAEAWVYAEASEVGEVSEVDVAVEAADPEETHPR